ncbi:MAG: exosortase/archaeosortase family protein [Candidatus Rokuibacteriota bacterium]
MIRLLAVLILAGIYAPVFLDLVRIWQRDTYAAHGMFVPLFSALLLWMDRAELRAAAGRGHPAGLIVILAGLGVLGLGRWGGSILLQGGSVAITAAGMVLWAFGPRCLRRAAFPVGFLVLMVPLPRAVVNAVTLDLQRFAGAFASLALWAFGIPFYRSGLLIELPTITLEVAEVCNGLRFLTALLVLTMAFAQVSLPTVPRKVVLVLSAIPIAILANAARVAIIAVGVHYVGPELASGTIHHTIGKAVWAFTLIPLVALGLLLRRRGESRPAVHAAEGEKASEPAPGLR